MATPIVVMLKRMEMIVMIEMMITMIVIIMMKTALNSLNRVPRLKAVLPNLNTGIKTIYPHGKLSHFQILTVSQFIIIEYQSLENVKSPV